MKKFVAVLFIIISCFYISFENQEPVLEVSYLEYIDENDYQTVSIDISKYSVSTKDISSLLENISLKKIEYKIPKLYQKLFSNWNLTYEFRDKNIEKGISQIEKLVSVHFKQNGYQKEVEKIYFYGLKIEMIEVYGKTSEIIALEKRIKNH